MPRILVIEDDVATSLAIERQLLEHRHDVVRAEDGASGLAYATSEYFDVITLDRMLPDVEGLALVSALRERSVMVPVLMISALSDVDERIAGIRAGGDDYLVKPFSSQEMVARVEALIRRSGSITPDTIIRAGALEINVVKRSVLYEGQLLRLPAMEYKLLEFLVRHAGRTLKRKFIFEQVWGYFFDPGANLINVHIARLRKKLDKPGYPPTIATIKGEGYRLEIG